MRKAVVIVLDSVRQDHVGCYGYGRDTTPNIDRMASGGSVLAGYVSEPVMPGTASAVYSFLSGQDEQIVTTARCPQNIVLFQRFARPSLFTSNHGLFCHAGNWDIGWDYRNLTESRPYEYRPCEDIVSWFLSAYRKVEPVLSLIWFVDTHSPYKYDSYWEIFYEDSLPTVSGDVRLYDPDLLKGNDGVPDFRKHMTYYDAAIRRVDAAIAPILALADEDTLVVVASDHGDFIGEFDHWFTHAYMSDPSEDYADVCNILRSTALVTSLLLEDIRIKVSLVDMTTTIASWLGLVEQDWWTGTSLVDFYPQEKVAIPVESDDVSLINERLRVLGYIE